MGTKDVQKAAEPSSRPTKNGAKHGSDATRLLVGRQVERHTSIWVFNRSQIGGFTTMGPVRAIPRSGTEAGGPLPKNHVINNELKNLV